MSHPFHWPAAFKCICVFTCVRKILNELSSDAPGVTKIEEGKPEEEGAPSGIPAMAVPTSLYQTSTGQYSMYPITSNKIFSFRS